MAAATTAEFASAVQGPAEFHDSSASAITIDAELAATKLKSLRFEEVPWGNTKRVNVLTGAERDETIAKDITELIGVKHSVVGYGIGLLGTCSCGRGSPSK